jgi:hypothetical protein
MCPEHGQNCLQFRLYKRIDKVNKIAKLPMHKANERTAVVSLTTMVPLSCS